jgi:(p)ppGpp synthase/HD superfamily hydrolase
VNMSAASADKAKGDGIATLRATLEIRQAEQLVRVLARLERLPYVQTARRIAG